MIIFTSLWLVQVNCIYRSNPKKQCSWFFLDSVLCLFFRHACGLWRLWRRLWKLKVNIPALFSYLCQCMCLVWFRQCFLELTHWLFWRVPVSLTIYIPLYIHRNCHTSGRKARPGKYFDVSPFCSQSIYIYTTMAVPVGVTWRMFWSVAILFTIYIVLQRSHQWL